MADASIHVAWGACAATGLTFAKLHEAVCQLSIAGGRVRLEVDRQQAADLAAQAQEMHAPKWYNGRLTEIIGIEIVARSMPRLSESTRLARLRNTNQCVEIACDDPSA